uniref:Protein furry n=1 Tax=Cacopsylla melanoneura TaxID=428564 RepID=A0A8D8TGL4_9HEMI
MFVPPRGSDKIRTASGPAIMSEAMFTPPDMEALCNSEELTTGDLGAQANNMEPHPLPMPEYGGYFAPLTEYLPDSNQPSSGFHRCNVAIMLLTDLVVDYIEVDWSVHLPLMLHILFLGLDHSRSLVLEHCKQCLLNLLLVLCEPVDQLTVAQILLNTQTRKQQLGLSTPHTNVTQHCFTDQDSEFDRYLTAPSEHGNGTVSTPTTSKPDPPPLIVVPEDEVASAKSSLNPDVKNMDIQHVITSLIEFLSSKHNQVLWSYEDITAKVWTIRSVEQLDMFLRHVLRLFRESLPHALISERWAQTALQLGLSCGSRHYAGRSLQIFRALCVPINSRMLTDILSRLVETVAETGEDMQGYVTELLLTLESAVDALESDFRPLDHMKELFKSTPNLNNKEPGGGGPSGKRSPGLNVPGGMVGLCSHMNGIHARSTSYSISYCTRRQANCTANLDNKAARGDMDSRSGGTSSPSAAKYSPNLCRSRSAQSLKLLGDSTSADDKMTILAQLFWLSVSLLESDYEHEYLLALRLLARVLHRLPLDRPDARDKVEKLQLQLKPSSSWPGVHALLLKGCTSPNTYEAVVPLLSQFTPLLELPVVDATQSVAFPMNVVALLPYMLLHYEDANELCIMSAENIAQLSSEKGKKLENLGTVMTLYSRRTFSKESFQWTKCVVKYLYDSYSHLSMTMLTFLVEVLEKGPALVQLPVLNIIHCMLHYVDLNSSSHFNAELLRVIAKHIEGPNYKEALFILKLVVTRSSTLVTPPQLHHQYISASWDSHSASSHSSFSEFKKELPGRTMEFTVDLSQTPVIGRKSVKPATSESEVSTIPASPRRSVSLSPGDSINITGWKRPWMSQSRVRECLVNVLTTCGQRVGLPKSPSDDVFLTSDNKVIFSQSSDLLERQSSMASSTEEVSGPDLSGGTGSRAPHPDHFGVFKDFDFLEYESESVEGESTDNFNWGVRRRPLSEGDENPEPRSIVEESLSEKTPLLTIRKLGAGVIEESSDDEIGSESPLDEIPPVPEFPNTSTGHIHHQPNTLNIRPRTMSDPRSDTSGSSTGDISELTPCNTSPNLAFRPILREDTEELFRLHIQSLLQQPPQSSLHLFHTLHRLIKDIVRKTVTLTRDATHNLTEMGSTAAIPLTSHFTNLAESLSNLAAEVPLVYFNPDVINLPPEPLKFGLLQMKEHTDTLLDRNDQAAECVDALRAVLKLQTLGEEGGGGGGGRSHEEPIVELGRALYKLYFQLMLLLESANKMIALVISTARNNQLQDVSADVILMRKTLVKAQEDIGIPTPTPQPTPPLGGADSEGLILEYLAQAKWGDALTFTRTHRNSCLSEAMLPSTSEEDDVTNLISLYCQQLLREKPDVFIATDTDLGHILTNLMEGLMQVLTAVSSIEGNVSTAATKHSSHLST